MPESLVNGSSEEVWTLNNPLAQSDPEVRFLIHPKCHLVQVEGLIKAEKARQRAGLEMIASENFTSLPVISHLLLIHYFITIVALLLFFLFVGLFGFLFACLFHFLFVSFFVCFIFCLFHFLFVSLFFVFYF